MKENFYCLDNRMLAWALGLKITALRMKCYSLGLKRMDLEYWTNEQIAFLKKSYRKMGDTELAEVFAARWPKGKGWSKKHIEKKRKYLNLKRTKKERSDIHQRNVDAGRFLLCPVKRWLKCGVAKEGEIRMWRENSGRYVPRVKINGKFIHWARWRWEQEYGPVPTSTNIVFKDRNPENQTIENLEAISNAELSRRNSKISSIGLSDNYVAAILTIKKPGLRKAIRQNTELLDLKRQQLIMERTINKINKKARHGKKQTQ